MQKEKLVYNSSNRPRQQHINIQGYFTNLDQYDKMTLNFLDDYDQSDSTFKSIIKKKSEIQSFTKSYLLQKEQTLPGNAPISSDKRFFYVKSKNKRVGYIDGIPHQLQRLKQHKVDLKIEIKTYNFNKNGNQVQGWYLELKKADLLEY